MTIRNLEHMFNPRSVAVIGASIQPYSVGGTVMRSLLAGGFDGPIMPVNPKYKAVAGVLAYPTIESLPVAPDLAVLCTPAATIPDLIARLGAAGTRAAIVMTTGLDRKQADSDRTLQQAMLEAAKPHLLRILGPNCLGLMIPKRGLNASFAHTNPLPGKIAFISQSGALATAVLDWAKSEGIGFSAFVSLGNSADVDFGDVLDFLGRDPSTRAILLYIEAVTEARKFMSAARAAARNKPVIAIKSGRVLEGAQAAAASHTGALTSPDNVYEAALRRAGILRVDKMEDLFDAVATLARARPLSGDRLTIVTNGGGPAVMATDALIQAGGSLSPLSKETLAALDEFLPANWSRANPVNVLDDTPPERYVRTLTTVLEDPTTNAVFLIHAPTAIVSGKEIAEALVPVTQETRRNVLACWLGREGMAEARRIFTEANIPTYDSPEDGVGAFMQMVNYRRIQEMLMETPPSAPNEFSPDSAAARAIVREILTEGRQQLTAPEAQAVLAAYGVPTVKTQVAPTPAEGARLAETMTPPLAVKIVSPDIIYKSDVGGVVLNLESAEAVRTAAEGTLKRLEAVQPQANVTGFAVQEMAPRSGMHELIIGATTDPVFGPVILFGQGGTAVEIIRDRAIALPPLNMALARELVNRTRVAELLAGYRGRPAADMAAIYLVLMKVSQLLIDIPEVVELDINPLLAGERGVLAIDARMRIKAASRPGAERLAIRPYPKALEEPVTLRDGEEILLRPIRPEDEPLFREFFDRLNPDDVRFRFFASVHSLAHSELARFTQIDFDREMAFVATRNGSSGQTEMLGEVRTITDPDNTQAELSIIVRSDLKGKGLGRILLDKMIRYCQSRGTQHMMGEVLRINHPMIRLAKKCDFKLRPSYDDEMVTIQRPL